MLDPEMEKGRKGEEEWRRRRVRTIGGERKDNGKGIDEYVERMRLG